MGSIKPAVQGAQPPRAWLRALSHQGGEAGNRACCMLLSCQLVSALQHALPVSAKGAGLSLLQVGWCDLMLSRCPTLSAAGGHRGVSPAQLSG